VDYLLFFLFDVFGSIIMLLAAIGANALQTYVKTPPWWLSGIERGLACSAVSLVAIAVLRLGSKIIKTPFHQLLCVLTASITVVVQQNWIFPTVIIAAGLITFIYNLIKKEEDLPTDPNEKKEKETVYEITISPKTGALLIAIFVINLVILELVVRVFGVKDRLVQLLELFYRFGSLIIGGGQVLIPLILNELVTELKYVTEAQFFNGLALSQAIPGPMFNLSVYLGFLVAGFPGAVIAWLGVFAPGIILIFAVLPFWKRLRTNKRVMIIMGGVNAAAIGLIVSAIYSLWVKSIKTPIHAMLSILLFGLVWIFNISAPFIVIISGFAGFLLSWVGLIDK